MRVIWLSGSGGGTVPGTGPDDGFEEPPVVEPPDPGGSDVTPGPDDGFEEPPVVEPPDPGPSVTTTEAFLDPLLPAPGRPA